MDITLQFKDFTVKNCQEHVESLLPYKIQMHLCVVVTVILSQAAQA